MDLKSGYPYWAVKNGLMAAFPALREDTACDVAVVGGGITGALITDELVRHGYDVVVLEERDSAGAAQRPARPCCSMRSTRT